MNTYVLIGAGMGTEAMLTQQARQAIQRADIVLSTGRLADGLTSVRADVQTLAFSQLAQRAQDSTGIVAILLSGDTGFYSAAKSLTQKLCGSGTVEILPGISSIQLFCARFHTAYDDAVLLSLHGRSGALLAPVSYNRKVIMLTGGENKAHVLCQRLARCGADAYHGVYRGKPRRRDRTIGFRHTGAAGARDVWRFVRDDDAKRPSDRQQPRPARQRFRARRGADDQAGGALAGCQSAVRQAG